VSLADEVRRILLEHPEILVEALTARPQALYEALAKLTPWEKLATREDVRALASRLDALEKEVGEIRREAATKDEVKALALRLDALEKDVGEIRRNVATKDDVKALALRLDALGARWGVVSDEAFRERVRELLKEAGYPVERWVYFDSAGYVFGRASEVELDIVVKDGRRIAVEITSAVKRGDLSAIRRKAELYAKATGASLDRVLVVTPYIHDRSPQYVLALAKELGIQIVAPGEAPEA